MSFLAETVISLALRIEEARALQARRPQPSPVNLKSVA